MTSSFARGKSCGTEGVSGPWYDTVSTFIEDVSAQREAGHSIRTEASMKIGMSFMFFSFRGLFMTDSRFVNLLSDNFQ
jgi:hypothetical protein